MTDCGTLSDELQVPVTFPLLGDSEHLQRRGGGLQAYCLGVCRQAQVVLLAAGAGLAGLAVRAAAHRTAQLLVSAIRRLSQTWQLGFLQLTAHRGKQLSLS